LEEVLTVGPEDSEKKAVKFYMMVNGQQVEVKPDFAEIKCSGDQQSDHDLALTECEFSMRMKLPRSIRCRSRKRLVKLLMANGIGRNAAHILAKCRVVWRNQRGIPEYQKTSYQSYCFDLWIRGIVKAEKADG